jgi:hypothetical protein
VRCLRDAEVRRHAAGDRARRRVPASGLAVERASTRSP